MGKKYDIVIKAGEYQNGNGETKSRWVNLGAVMEGKDGGFFALLDPGVNLAAYIEPGRDRVMASLFAPRDSNGQQPQRQPQQNQPTSRGEAVDIFPDDISF